MRRAATCRGGWTAGWILVLSLLANIAAYVPIVPSAGRPCPDSQGLLSRRRGCQGDLVVVLNRQNQRPVLSRSFQTRARSAFSLASNASPSSAFSSDDAPVNPANEKTLPPSSSSTVLEVTISLVKALVGTGMLALPSGVAAMSDFPQLLWGANALLLLLGALSAYTFWLCGRLAHATGGRTLGELWHRVYPQSSGRAVSWSNLLYCAGCCLTYSLVLGDSLSGLARGLLPPSAAASIPSWILSRQAAILAVTGAVLWPLCNLSSLSALAPFSALGVLSSAAVAAFVALRCPAIVKSSPYAAASPAGRYLADLPLHLQPQFGTYRRLRGPAPLVLAAMGCVAWMAHFSAPDFYHALKKPEDAEAPGSLSSQKHEQQQQLQLWRFSFMTGMGYSVVAVLNAILLSAGFLTFGGHSQGIVLNNYAVADLGATLSRFLVAVSVTCGYPFLFSACLSAAREIFDGRDERGEGGSSPSSRRSSATLLGAITAASLVVRDAGFVVSLNGAVCGAVLIYVFPSLLYLRQFPFHSTKGADSLRPRLRRLERAVCRLLIAFGGASAVLGAVAAVLVAYFPHLLR